MRFSVKYSPDEDNTTAADELGVLSSMRQLGGDAGSASPDGHRPRLPVELQPAAGRWPWPRPPAHVWACGVLLRPPLRSWDSVSLSCSCSLHESQLGLHWEELKLSSANIVLVAGYTETRIHMQQPVQRYSGQ